MAEAITYLRGLHQVEMERIGLMVAVGANPEIAEAVAAKLQQAITHLERCLAKDGR